MAKPKLTFTVKPTFPASVSIPVAGGRPVDVEFTFKGRTKSQYREFWEGISKYEDDTALVLDIASGWELEEPFERASLDQLFESHIGAAKAILEAYAKEMTGARLGN